MISRKYEVQTLGPFNNTTVVSANYDLTPFLGASFTVGVTGASGAGTMKLQGSIDGTNFVDIPATNGGATATQTITIAAQHYLSTGNCAFFPIVRVSVTSSNTNPITAVISGFGKG